MKVGDLIADKEYPEHVGIIISRDESRKDPYGVLADNGKFEYLPKDYIENGCEVLSESRRLGKN
jgi:hypothetical protein